MHFCPQLKVVRGRMKDKMMKCVSLNNWTLLIKNPDKKQSEAELYVWIHQF